MKVKRALISVSDKEGIEDFARELHKMGIELLSTGGTAKLLLSANIPVKMVSDWTGFPEILDGRVKTLHPKIHGGLLALRDNPEHIRQVQQYGIGLIDMVVVNLYPFEKVIQKEGVKLEEAIENIDIGGPSMLRSAAKNFESVAVICNPDRYKEILQELKANDLTLSRETLASLAIEVFNRTSGYDSMIYEFLSDAFKDKVTTLDESKFAENLLLRYEKLQDLRYGENPHQKGAFYKDAGFASKVREYPSIGSARQLHGKELSFNNILDLDAALQLVKEFDEPAACVIKHTNPCGVALRDSLKEAYKAALECDKLSAFGSIVGLNKRLNKDTANEIVSSDFVECVIAPGYDTEALEALKKKKNMRVIETGEFGEDADKEWDLKKVSGGLLIQDKDVCSIDALNLKVVTKKKPSDEELKSLIFGWAIAKHVRSNAIVLVKNKATVGIGAGQMSRVDSVIIASRKAGERSRGSVLASDAFFPKEDGIEMAASAGVTAIIQPGGSIRDEEVIKTADAKGISMIFTGVRHFKH